MRSHYHRNKSRRGGFRGRQARSGCRPRGFRSGTGMYRSREGMVMGVCKGLADQLGIPVFWIRALCVVILLFSGIWPFVGIYVLASFLLKPRPVKPLETEAEEDFYDTYVSSRSGAIRTLKSRFEALDRRIRRMEDTVTAREFEWDRKFNT